MAAPAVTSHLHQLLPLLATGNNRADAVGARGSLDYAAAWIQQLPWWIKMHSHHQPVWM